jgi:hypothetical protein
MHGHMNVKCGKKSYDYLANFNAQSRNLSGSSEQFVYLPVFEPGHRPYNSETYVRRLVAQEVPLGTLFCYWHNDFS